MEEPLHAARFPSETGDYRVARDALLRAEIDLRRQTESVALMRRDLPLGGEVSDDYTFDAWDAAVGHARSIPISELFEDGKDTLFIYSFMFEPGPLGPIEVPCPVCTSIIDGIDGAVPHITQHINFAVAAKASIERFSAHARARGWRYARLLSSANTTYNTDYLAEGENEEQMATGTVFVRRDGKIHHFWSSELGWYRVSPARTRAMWTSCGRSGASSTARPPAEAPIGCPDSTTVPPTHRTRSRRRRAA